MKYLSLFLLIVFARAVLAIDCYSLDKVSQVEKADSLCKASSTVNQPTFLNSISAQNKGYASSIDLPPNVRQFFINGTFTKKSHQTIASLVQEFADKPLVFHINSNGGYAQNYQISANAIYQHGNVTVIIDNSNKCESACALAFMGAKKIYGTLGFHGIRCRNLSAIGLNQKPIFKEGLVTDLNVLNLNNSAIDLMRGYGYNNSDAVRAMRKQNGTVDFTFNGKRKNYTITPSF